MKKLILVFAILCMSFCVVMAGPVREDEAIAVTDPQARPPAYEQTFDGQTALPTGWYLPTGNPSGATVSVKDDALCIESLASITPVAAYFDTDLANYTVEADFTVDELYDDSRWFGICFRVQETAGWAKVSAGFGAVTALNYFNKTNISGGGYVEQIKSSLLIKPELNKTHRISVTCYGNRVSFLFNGEYVLHGELLEGYDVSGDVGVCISGVRCRVDNFRIYEATEPGLEVSYDVASVVIPETGIVNPPAVVATTATSAGARAAVTMLALDDGGAVSDGEGNALGTLSEAVAAMGDTSIPAFRVDSEAQADTLAAFAKDSFVIDCFVVTTMEQASLLRRVMDKAVYVRGVIEVDQAPTTYEAAKELLFAVNRTGANTVLFHSAISREMAFWYQCRMLTVWTVADTETEIYGAIASGVNGIVSEHAASIYDVYATFTEPTVIREPIVMAHRGACTLYPQNTLKGYQLAYELGAHAIEIDVNLTADNKIALLHDSTLDGQTTGTGPIVNYTMEWLKQNVIVDVFPGVQERIPSLDEVFAYFTDKDIVFMLDIKTGDMTVISVLRQLIDAYDMADQCVVMDSSNEHLRQFEIGLPEVARCRGGLNTVIGSLEHDESIEAGIMTMAPWSMQPFPYWYNTDGDWSYLYEYAARGWLTWSSTCNGQKELDERCLVTYGATCVLTDDFQNTMDYIYAVDAKDATAKSGEAFTLFALVEGKDGTFREACDLRVIGEGVVTKTADGYVFAESGTYCVVPVYHVSLHRANFRDLVYDVIGSPVTVTVR